MTTDVSCPVAAGSRSSRAPCSRRRVAIGEEHDVDDPGGDEAGEERGRVHPGADRSDDTGVAELDECGQGDIERLVHVVVGVVDEHDVDPLPPEPAAALVEAAQHAITREVPTAGQSRRHGEPVAEVVAGLESVVRFEQPPDLRRHHGFG